MKNKITLKTILVNKINKSGKNVLVRKLKTKELCDVTISFNKNIKYKLTKKELNYVYRKIFDYKQCINCIINNLKKDLHSRRAVLPFDICNVKPNCLTHIQFLVRNNALISLVYSRSLDVKKNIYIDYDIVKRISNKICDELNLKLKYIKFFVGSLHYYVK